MTPDLEHDIETQRVRAAVMAGLFGDEPDPPRIGRYPVLARLGEGGMGVVYACYDVELDRRIAVKVLRADTESASQRARMGREARAMAKLNHANVAHVYEVDDHRGRMFVAMEFVKGQTLRQWLAAESRTWSEVLGVCIAAGRGLAAAHEHQLTHRDFKPDNVMVGDDGRVRVMDFGLVSVGTKPIVPEMPDGAVLPTLSEATDGALTGQGDLLGTPAYMPLEQLRGDEAGPKADQFAFCVATWEALHGRRPFAGTTVGELARSLEAGDIVDSPASARVPSWIRRVLRRGLSIEPSARFSTLAALLTELEQGRGRAMKRRLAVAFGAVVLLASGAEGVRRHAHARAIRACEDAGASIGDVWNDETRVQLRDAVMATGVVHAGTTAEKVVPWLDAHAGAWQLAGAEACLRAGPREQWDSDMLDRSEWCLDERRLQLEVVVAELLRADERAVHGGVSAASALSSVDSCLDEGFLQRLPSPPSARREEVREVRATIAMAGADWRAGRSEAGLERARLARQQAIMLQWPMLAAAALDIEASLLDLQGDYDAAERSGTKAYFEAAEVGAWDVAATAATGQALLVGARLARHAEGFAWGDHAKLALRYASDPEGLLEAARLGHVAAVHHSAGEYSAALSSFEQALALQERALGPDHPELAKCLTNMAFVSDSSGDYERARTLLERAISLQERAFGVDHPNFAMSLNLLGGVYEITGDTRTAKATYERALAIRERAFAPDHPEIAQSLVNLGGIYLNAGDHAAAKALVERALVIKEGVFGRNHPEVALTLNNLASIHFAMRDYPAALVADRRALAIREKALGEDHPDVAVSIDNLASVYFATGDYAEARELRERALEIRTKSLGPRHPDVAMSLEHLARTHFAAGELAQALAMHKQALDIREEKLGNHYDVANSLWGLADVYTASGEHELAIPLLERAVAIYAIHEGPQPGEPWARFRLAQALDAAGGQRTRARALAEQARDGWRAMSGEGPDELKQVEAWLAKRVAAR